MTSGEFCTRKVVGATRNATMRAAARLMREHRVGSLGVDEAPNESRPPEGIITDRDVGVAVVASGLDQEVMQIGDIMATELISLPQESGNADAVEVDAAPRVRRIVITNARGNLAGIASADDILALLAEELSSLESMVSSEQMREAGLRNVSL